MDRCDRRAQRRGRGWSWRRMPSWRTRSGGRCARPPPSSTTVLGAEIDAAYLAIRLEAGFAGIMFSGTRILYAQVLALGIAAGDARIAFLFGQGLQFLPGDAFAGAGAEGF